jgi:hypothetical protein
MIQNDPSMGKWWENDDPSKPFFWTVFFLAKKNQNFFLGKWSIKTINFFGSIFRQSHNSEYIPHGRGTSLAPSPMASVTGEGSTVLRMNSTNSACQLHHTLWEYYGNIYIYIHIVRI